MPVAISAIYTEPRFIKYCRQLTRNNGLHDDLLQHVAIIIHDQEKITGMQTTDDLYQYFRTIAWRQKNHEHSPFNKAYKDRIQATRNKPGQKKPKRSAPAYIEELTRLPYQTNETDNFRQFINTKLKERHRPANVRDFVQKEIFALYLKTGSIREIVRAYGMEFNQVRKVIVSYKLKIEKEYATAINT